jgi:hypothetical protein
MNRQQVGVKKPCARGGMMSKLSDAELSLAVVKILEPEYEWSFHRDIEGVARHASHPLMGGYLIKFDHTTDDAGMKMCRFLVESGCSAIDLFFWISDGNRAMAEAIVNIAESNV